MSAWASALLSVLLVSLASLVGLAALALRPARLRQVAAALVSFAVGALLGDTFLHLLPEAFERWGTRSLAPPLLVLSGLLLFFLVEKLLRHPRGPLHRHHHPDADSPARPELAAINVVGDAIHNFIDGALIAASYLASPSLGVATTLAVLLHELPQELGDFGVLIHSGMTVKRATLLNLASASLAVLGASTTLLLGATAGARMSEALLPITAGGFIYLAAADLIPELQHDRSHRAVLVQTSLIALGSALMAALRLQE